MDRDAAIRKVRGLRAVADSESAPDGERENARQLADRLMAKHQLADVDVEPEEETVFFGLKLFFYGNHVRPHLDRIKEEIDAVLELMASQSAADRAKVLSEFYRDFKRLADGQAYSRRQAIVDARDEAIREVYREAVAEWERRDAETWADEPEEEDPGEAEASELWRQEYRHQRGLFAAQMATTDVRKDTLERIVGQSSKALWEKIHRAHRCIRCGLDGKEGREMVGLFHVESPDDKHKRDWVHEACLSDQEKEWAAYEARINAAGRRRRR